MATIAPSKRIGAGKQPLADVAERVSSGVRSEALPPEHTRWSMSPMAVITLSIGAVAIALPTMIFVAHESWATDEGAHGPIVLATGLWLLWQLCRNARGFVAPPPAGRAALVLAALLPLYMLSRITQVVELEGYLMYACLLATLYGVVGVKLMRRIWFPLFYLAFIFPPPETLVALATIPMKAGISEAAVRLLSVFGYPIGSAGVTIYIGQYQLLVAAACSGLNSIISLSAISLFYIYLRHQADWRYALLLVFLIVPVALFANLVRVLALILLTYHAGEAAASGFLHNSAGLVTFSAALLAIFAIDSVLKPVWTRLNAKQAISRPAEVAL
jgi:exosortase